MNKEQAIYNFWAGFGLPAYDANSVPDGARLPYITYETATDDFGNELPGSASLWYRSGSWEDITKKKDEITEAIGRGGKVLHYDGGAVWIQKRAPWASRMGDPSDDLIRRIVLQYSMEFLD